MKKYKRALLLAAIVLEAVLVVQLKQYQPSWNRCPALTVVLAAELFGIPLLDALLGLLALAFAGVLWVYAALPARHGRRWMARGNEPRLRAGQPSGEELPGTKSPSTKDRWG